MSAAGPIQMRYLEKLLGFTFRRDEQNGFKSSSTEESEQLADWALNLVPLNFTDASALGDQSADAAGEESPPNQ